MTSPRFCEECGTARSATARFCPNCGFAFAGGATARPVSGTGDRGLTRLLPWLLPTGAVLAVLIFAIVSATPKAPEATGVALDGMGGTATDISQLSADERVDRLFNRVMAASTAGKTDSVAFFAPMAISSFAAIEPLDPHRRYDLGLIYLVSGEPALARAESDTILKIAPKHLLGLALAMRAAAAAGDEPARKRFGARFLQALPAERARGPLEYTDHAADIDVALAEAEGRAKKTAVAPIQKAPR